MLALLGVGLHNIAVKGEKNDYIEKNQHQSFSFHPFKSFVEFFFFRSFTLFNTLRLLCRLLFEKNEEEEEEVENKEKRRSVQAAAAAVAPASHLALRQIQGEEKGEDVKDSCPCTLSTSDETLSLYCFSFL